MLRGRAVAALAALALLAGLAAADEHNHRVSLGGREPAIEGLLTRCGPAAPSQGGPGCRKDAGRAPGGCDRATQQMFSARRHARWCRRHARWCRRRARPPALHTQCSSAWRLPCLPARSTKWATP
jgi:hypothetical protein